MWYTKSIEYFSLSSSNELSILLIKNISENSIPISISVELFDKSPLVKLSSIINLFEKPNSESVLLEDISW